MNNFLIRKRIRESSISRGSDIEDFYSDRSRIIFCSSFRRLQQKAQVFSLEPNASVRTRLTHSLEVSDLGRTLANEIAQELARQGSLTDNEIPMVVAIVENACLLHDIGNPPFGHFGEAAIRDWAKNSEILNNKIKGSKNKKLLKNLLSDFYEFDGNPQGFRTVTRLHTERDEFGLNLTYSTLLCIIKYSRAAGETTAAEGVSGDIIKKAGYFQTEKELVEKIYKESGLVIHHRYPFTYIMEAADDIAYCMSDIADGIEKGIISEKRFLEVFTDEWNKKNQDEKGNPLPIPVKMPEVPCEESNHYNIDISIPWSREARCEAISTFINNKEEISAGTAPSLINKDGLIGKVLETIKVVSRRYLYSSIKAESIELTGYSVITGILKRYEKLLRLSYSDFKKMVNHDSVTGKDYEKRLFNRLGIRYVRAYDFAVQKLNNDKNFETYEWWLRIHLIIDHISGMTDEFALETYQMLEGIQLLKT